MENISDINIYNSGMAKSLQDKLFFMDIIGNDIDGITDYGCADGTLLKAVSEIDPYIHLTGLDFNEDMIKLAEKNVPTAEFYTSNHVHMAGYDNILNLSSVLHEVFSYSTQEEEKEFWADVRNGGYKYIVIRDMIYNENPIKLSKEEDVNKLFVASSHTQLERLFEFEAIWGKVNNYKNLVHYLLKYRYVENWNREVRENYLGYSVEDIIKNIGTDYSLIYRKDYILPFLRDKIKEDFSIELSAPTHTNLIFKLN